MQQLTEAQTQQRWDEIKAVRDAYIDGKIDMATYVEHMTIVNLKYSTLEMNP